MFFLASTESQVFIVNNVFNSGTQSYAGSVRPPSSATCLGTPSSIMLISACQVYSFSEVKSTNYYILGIGTKPGCYSMADISLATATTGLFVVSRKSQIGLATNMMNRVAWIPGST